MSDCSILSSTLNLDSSTHVQSLVPREAFQRFSMPHEKFRPSACCGNRWPSSRAQAFNSKSKKLLLCSCSCFLGQFLFRCVFLFLFFSSLLPSSFFFSLSLSDAFSSFFSAATVLGDVVLGVRLRTPALGFHLLWSMLKVSRLEE